jgi:hypothetical protein
MNKMLSIFILFCTLLLTGTFLGTYFLTLFPYNWTLGTILFSLTVLFIAIQNDPHQAFAVFGFSILLIGGFLGNTLGILIGLDLYQTAQLGSLVSFWTCMILLVIFMRIDAL